MSILYLREVKSLAILKSALETSSSTSFCFCIVLYTTQLNRLFIHTEYSKKDMPKKAVRSIVNATLSNTLAELGISQTTAAYSRPKNIKDLLSKAKLHQAEGKEVSVYYSGGLPSKQVHSPSFFIF